ncbi:4a-hydroxytetrahydrobiopterin dehydratase [Variovorax sp. ZT4R33]|uniref:4a-hydroxytetrahydrobiopterin dehydratase n=1 Tax=Variovorax sp. ZT4R33 TaxID=3443743 RepID=UPI003F45BB44
MRRLDAEAVVRLRGQSPSWEFSLDRGGLMTREFVFGGFAEAFAFMTQIALATERLDHHPEWSNVYNRVRIVLTTHDVHGLSMHDATLSALIDRLYAALSPQRESA